MPGGAGKTLVGLWVAEGLHNELEGRLGTVVVVLPSLLLVEQTLMEWNKHRSLEMECMCVASDERLGRSKNLQEMTLEELAQDLEEVEGGEGSITVTTDAEVVAEFLSAGGTEMRVVFSTYHSARVLKEAQALLMDHQFGLAVFDEAHHMATSVDTFWAEPLEDDFVAIQRRLFLTATPRCAFMQWPGPSHSSAPVIVPVPEARPAPRGPGRHPVLHPMPSSRSDPPSLPPSLPAPIPCCSPDT